MKRPLRWLAAILLALIVPMQATAAACAQLCMKAKAAHVMSAGPMHSGGHSDCDPTEPASGDGKCCHAHTFMMEPPLPAAIVDIPSFEPLRFVVRWTSFIPEEPSPPPIAFAR